MPTSRLDVDLTALERNVTVLREVVQGNTQNAGSPSGKVSICAVLKQDAYGAGAVRVGKRLAGLGVDMFGVYGLDEARQLADAVPSVPILVLMPVHGVDRQDPLYRHASAGRLHITVHGLDQFAAVQEMAGRIGVALPVHIQVDTGLSRGGCHPEEAAKVVERVLNSPKIRLGGLMTHFSSPCCDDRLTREQARMFRDFVEAIKPAVKAAFDSGGAASKAKLSDLALHAANSCAMFRSKNYHGTMVRAGQSLLGYCGYEVPEGESFEFRAQMGRLEPAVRWVSSVVHMQEIPAGWAVGYGATWRAPIRADGRKTRIALVPVGYADGYPRSLGGRGSGGPGVVGFTGRLFERRGGAEGDDAGRTGPDGHTLPIVYAPVVGRVSMDQITVDVTDVPESYLKFGKHGVDIVGPEVELYSRDAKAPNFIGRLAEAAGSITHEMLCRVSPKVERVYRMPAQPEMVSAANVRLNTATPLRHGGVGGGIGGVSAVAQ